MTIRLSLINEFKVGSSKYVNVLLALSLRKMLKVILLSLVFIPNVSYAERNVDSILGVYLIPEVEKHFCLRLEKQSDGSVSNTTCQLKMKYVNDLCLRVIETNYPERVPNEEVKLVEAEFNLCRVFILLGEEYEFGIGS